MGDLGRAVLVLLASLLLGACARGVVGTAVGPADAKRILVASYPSDYKDRIAQGLADRYRDRCQVTQASVRDLNRVDPARYDVLVIVDQLMAWQLFNFDASAFLGGIDDPAVRRKVVLYLTAGTPKPDYRFQDFDALTGATAPGREAEVIDTIAARVDAVLAAP